MAASSAETLSGAARPLSGLEWLLPTKISAPPPRPQLVQRQRLLERLEQAVRLPLTVVAAPAGFGKTTLLSEWRATPVGAATRLAWVSLDEGDNDPARFWSYLLAALQTVQPGLGESTLAAMRSLQAPPLEALVVAVLRDLVGLDRDVVLVLDDYHLIETESIHDGLTFLLAHLPARLHLVIISRAMPPLALARLRARGQVATLGADQLRFSDAESSAFLGETMGLGLSAEAIGALAAASDGWAAGLQLAALAVEDRDDPADFSARFFGGHPYLLEYVVEEVLSRQPEPVQAFLLRTSILDRLSASLCAAVTGEPNGQAMLDYLERANLFLVRLDAQRSWCRYHPLFGEALRQRLRLQEPAACAELHRRAAGWFEANGLVREAVEHSLAAQDWPAVRRLLPLIGGLFEQGELATVERWLAALPDEVLMTSARFSVFRAWTLYFSGQIDAAERLCTAAAAQAGQAADLHAEGRVAQISAHIAATRGDGHAAVELGRRGFELLPPEDRARRGTALAGAGIGHSLLGELDQAVEALEQAAELCLATGRGFLGGLMALSQLGLARALQGDLGGAERIYRDVLGRCGEGAGYIRSGVLIRLGDLRREQGDLDGAATLLEQGIALDQRWGGAHRHEGYLALARLRRARGRLDSALEAIAAAEAGAHRLGHRAAEARARASGARLHLAAGNLSAALRWADERHPEQRDPLCFEYEADALTEVRLWIAQGQHRQALDPLGQLRGPAEAAGRTVSLAEMLMLEALARDAGHDAAGAVEAILAALALTEAGGFVRLFADEGAPLARLLEAVLSARRTGAIDTLAPSTQYVERLLAAANASAPRSDSSPGRPEVGPLGARGAGLPVLPTPLIGRQAELAAGRRILLEEGARLLTLTGPPGVGKTSLALVLGRRIRERFADGASLVDLAPVTDMSLVATAIADTLAAGGAQPAERLIEALRDQQRLLVLDNFEHLLGAAPLVAELLEACERLTVIVTSRAALRLRWEHELPIPPLGLPAPGQRPTPASLADVPAVALFVERARARNPGFALTNQNAPIVADVCIQLEGLPLAIELAAARTRTAPLEAIRSQLAADDPRTGRVTPLELLVGGPDDLPARQRALRNAVNWSHALLGRTEQVLFRRLAVFSGGCTVAAAEAVCDANWETLAALVDSNLLRHEALGSEPRYRLLEPIRHFADEQLVTHGELEPLQARHAAYYLALAERAETGLNGPDQATWLNILDDERQNLRAMARRARERGDAETVLRLGAALWRFWWARSNAADARERVENILSLAAAAPPSPARFKALHGAGVLASELGDYPAAQTLLEESVAVARQLDDRQGIADGLNSLGWLAQLRGAYAAARTLLQQSLALYQQLDDRAGAAAILARLGYVAFCEDNRAESRELCQQSLALAREADDRRVIGDVLFNLGMNCHVAQELAAARRYYEQSRTILRALGHWPALAQTLHLEGHAALLDGDLSAARTLFRESLVTAREAGNRRRLAFALWAIATLAAAEGEPERAILLDAAAWAATETMGAVLGIPVRKLYDAQLQPARQALGDVRHLAAQTAGRATPLEQAVEDALTWLSTPAAGRPPAEASAPSPPPLADRLSVRELELLRLMACGASNQHLADQLVVAVSTVKTHINRIFRKLDATSRVEAVARARELGLLS